MSDEWRAALAELTESGQRPAASTGAEYSQLRCVYLFGTSTAQNAAAWLYERTTRQESL